jgi:hypothetical protein
MGWTVAVTRQALADCEAVEVRLDDGAGWVAPGDEAKVKPAGSWVALLPSLDPTTMGWKERDWYLPSASAQAFDRMGNAGPTIWVDGQVAGAWAQTKDGEIRTHFFVEPTGKQASAVESRVEELRQMIGDTRFTVRFPSPVSTALAKGSPLPD